MPNTFGLREAARAKADAVTILPYAKYSREDISRVAKTDEEQFIRNLLAIATVQLAVVSA
jgi:hypothetical protein